MHYLKSLLLLSSTFLAVQASPTATLKSRAPSTWTHPGIFLNQNQLDLMKTRVADNLSPWIETYELMLENSLASLTRTASPVQTVQCGSYSIPDVGCTVEREDAIAAYTLSLMWYASGTQSYADKAIEYMDAWSSTVKAHNDSNAQIQAGWVGSTWARAAEIIRYSDAGWSSSGISAFETMLSKVYLPVVIVGSPTSNGNWDLGTPASSSLTKFHDALLILP